MPDLQSTKVKGIIDRIEGNLAVVELEDQTTRDISLDLFDFMAKPGLCISIIDCGVYETIKEDKKATAERAVKIQKLMDDVFE